MDTPDKAAGLADVQIADAVNKEWLVRSSCSARSSQISSNLRGHREQLSVSINDSDIFYGSMPTSKYIGAGARPTLGPADGTTSLIDNSIGGGSRRASKPENYYHLYDNIGFADSALLVGSNSSRESAGIHNDGFYRHDKSSLGTDASSQPQGNLWSCCCFRGKFRIFLACYVLLGITLAIYSRNALSLAAVGMVANNVADKELVSILAASLAASTTTEGHHLIAASNQSNINTTAIANNDGSCLISDRHLERRQHDANSQRAAIGNVISELPPGLDFKQAHKYQIEQAFKASIRRRVERGELVDWSPSEQGLIFAAGSVGNLLISIPITRLGEIYGPKWVIFAALAGATIQAALMPLIAPSHIALVIMFQVLFSGLAFGADCVAYTLFAYWLTPTEIAFFVACLVVCYQLGAILSNVITAQILIRALDWSWCFYVPAILCGLWTLVWMLIGASEPAKSSIISRDELDYIVLRSKLSRAGADHQDGRRSSSSYYESTDDLIRQCDNYDDDDDKENAKQNCQHRPVSWLKLARDPNIWAIIAVKFTLRWYFSVNISLMPTYLTTVAHMSVDTIGKFSAMQSVIGLVSGVFMGYITKSAVSKRPFNLSLPAFRKIFQSVVNFGLAGSLVVFITFDCNLWVTVVTLTIACVCVNFYVAAALQLPLDLSPSYCGLITSITNTLALGQAIGAPISGLILNKAPKDRNLWRIVWGIAILLNILSGLLFILLVNSKPKDYSKSRPSTRKKKSKS